MRGVEVTAVQVCAVPVFFFSSRRRHTRCGRDWSSDVCSSDLFARMSPKAVRYEITMEDPATWTRPWTLMIPLRNSNEKIYEYACHEGNVGMVEIGRASCRERV